MAEPEEYYEKRKFNHNNIFLPMWQKLLIFLNNKDGNLHQISQRERITYSHLTNIIKDLEKHDLLTSERYGRVREYTITKKGKVIVEHCIALNKICHHTN